MPEPGGWVWGTPLFQYNGSCPALRLTRTCVCPTDELDAGELLSQSDEEATVDGEAAVSEKGLEEGRGSTATEQQMQDARDFVL